MTDKIEEIRRALEVYESDFALDADLVDLGPEMARIVLEQAEEIERLRKRVEAADVLEKTVMSFMFCSNPDKHEAMISDIALTLTAYRATEDGE